jgi:hypothetical protein
VTIGLSSSLGFVVLAAAASAQTLAPRELDARGAARRSVHFVFDGFVLAPDGTPAPGAVVTSSAGGRSTTDLSGRYWLEAEVPRAARFVHLTAVGGTDTSLSASTRLELGGASGFAQVDSLQLGAGDAC